MRRPWSDSYQRENLSPVTPEECLQDGEWTKWVIERCTPEQKEMFLALRSRLSNQGLDYLTDNNVLRYCKSYLWNMETAYIKLVNAEKWRKDNGCMEIYMHEIRNEMKMKVRLI